MIVEFFNIALPNDPVDTALVVYFERQVSSVIVPPELTDRNGLLLKGPCHWFGLGELLFLFVK
jgi:hypothetical protein